MAEKSSLGLARESGLRTFESLRDAGERGRAAMKSLAAPRVVCGIRPGP